MTVFYVTVTEPAPTAEIQADRVYGSLSEALAASMPGTQILVAPGHYQAPLETFPLHIPSGVTVQGAGDDPVAIWGHGPYASEDFGEQQITLYLESEAVLAGVTITNPHPQGTGIWVDQGRSRIQDCLICQCGREGIFITGRAQPQIYGNHFDRNGKGGIFAVRQTKGEWRGNRFTATGNAMALSDQAAPLIRENHISGNRLGLMISRQARPVLRRNAWWNNDHQWRNKGEFVLEEPPDGSPAAHWQWCDHWAETIASEWVRRGWWDTPVLDLEGVMTQRAYARLLGLTFTLPLRSLGEIALDEPEQRAIAMGFFGENPEGEPPNDRPLLRWQMWCSLAQGLGIRGGSPEVLGDLGDRHLLPSQGVTAAAIALAQGWLINSRDQSSLEPLRPMLWGEGLATLHQVQIALGYLPAQACGYRLRPGLGVHPFRDSPHHWSRDFIQVLGWRGWLWAGADGQFQPDALISRAEFATWIARCFTLPVRRPPAQFLDCNPLPTAIQQAYQGGFIQGFPDGTFHPQQPLKRIHGFTALAQGLALPPTSLAIAAYVSDDHQVPPYAREDLARAIAAGLVMNYPQPNQLRPLDWLTRGEAAALIYQGLVYQKRLLAIPCAYHIHP